MTDSPSRWDAERIDGRGAAYDTKWEAMAAAGAAIHGEVDFVCRLGAQRVLDAGCGTGRVAIELARRGVDVIGVDLDATMLDQARAKAPELHWIHASIQDVQVGNGFDVVVAAGNVMIFLRPGTESAVIANLAGHLDDGGHLVSGFQLDHAYGLDRYDADCAAAGLILTARYSTWDAEPWSPASDYAVSVHRRGTRAVAP